jgi:prevent-host-death family protein
MSEVGLRELRQNAIELVRRAEAGEQVTITVAGRPAAVLGPTNARTWRRWDEIAQVFTTLTDPDWATERDILDDTVLNPWAGR